MVFREMLFIGVDRAEVERWESCERSEYGRSKTSLCVGQDIDLMGDLMILAGDDAKGE